MICASLGNCSMRDLHGNIRRAASSADLLEIRADTIPDFSLASLLKYKSPRPLVFSCYSRSHGGAFKGSEAQRIDLLLAAIISRRFEYITLDMVDPFDLPASVGLLLALASRVGTKIILAYHNYHNTSDNLERIYRQLAAFKPAAIKIVATACRFSDNFRIFSLAQKYAARSGPRLIAFCMGEKGLISRILYRRFGLFMAYAAHRSGQETAAGQISLDLMKYFYRADTLNRRTRIFGLMGQNIGHSYSPLLFNGLFRLSNINAVYLPFDLEPKTFRSDFRLIRKMLRPEGFSITSPYKMMAIKETGELSRTARAIGAINTIYKRSNNLVGANTDWLGVIETLFILRRKLNHREAFIIGSGGASRAIAYALRNSGIKTTIFSRRGGKNIVALNRLPQYCKGSGAGKIIINATPIGMLPNINASPVPKSCLKKGMIVFDMIYNPSQTRLLKDARQKGCTTINGMRMFLTQAMKQMELFLGRKY